MIRVTFLSAEVEVQDFPNAQSWDWRDGILTVLARTTEITYRPYAQFDGGRVIKVERVDDPEPSE